MAQKQIIKDIPDGLYLGVSSAIQGQIAKATPDGLYLGVSNIIMQGRPVPKYKENIYTDINEGDALYILHEYVNNLPGRISVVSMAYKENQYDTRYIEKIGLSRDSVDFFLPSFANYLDSRFRQHLYYDYFVEMLNNMKSLYHESEKIF
ncbi:uncharacterized protein EV154DRAFT_477496 [Mucor mucedo]|uniref:uncharacterized protein n=1 Tax=Mucor mucedo TaxID=29922 RepID=UPI00221F551A|nr:uncharacterized protein EV154DRAFT_477496 [Mucor mucedo]KAI7895369.1 hypothetical protein EV154DRAFT_477496 [Mucor mucedo]